MTRTTTRRFTGRLDAIEKAADSRRLVDVYRLADGTSARLSAFDALAAMWTGLTLDYAQRHGEPHQLQPPTTAARTLARLDPDTNDSVAGRLMQQLSANWCNTYDNPQEDTPC